MKKGRAGAGAGAGAADSRCIYAGALRRELAVGVAGDGGGGGGGGGLAAVVVVITAVVAGRMISSR